MKFLRSHVMICGGADGTSENSAAIAGMFESEIKKRGLEQEIGVLQPGDFGVRGCGQMVAVHPDNIFYCNVTPDDVMEIMEEHLVKGKPVERLIFKPGEDAGIAAKSLSTLNLFYAEYRIALRNCGRINPEIIDEYIERDGYKALEKTLKSMSPAEVVEEIKKSGLRGRGGAGFPTGRKWEVTAGHSADQKFVLCNADEGDPGAFMDRSILEGDPHSVIEGMIIAGYAIGATQGYVYVRAEYPIAVERLQAAVEQARERGYLGDRIMGTDISFDLELRLGAGAFVCGEETAMMNSIEGNRGEPRTKPPFPAEKGLWHKPTLLNNVETFANIAPIINRGSDWFFSIGTEKSKGTKVFAVCGKIRNTGLVEVPMGTTVGEIVFEVGGGIPNGREFKAAQTGGPSGGCIPASLIDTPIDYDSLAEIGSIMGSGGLIIVDDSTCMVDLARFFLEFTCDESCGKCTACRVGTKRILEILNRITSGEAAPEELDNLEILCSAVKESSLCGLGQGAPNPVLSTLKYFRHEYEAHVHDKYCPSGVCKALSKYEIIPDKCKMCGKCAKNCPVECISGVPKETPYVIDQERCVKCGTCYDKCPFDAIKK